MQIELPEISPQELKQKLESDTSVLLFGCP